LYLKKSHWGGGSDCTENSPRREGIVDGKKGSPSSREGERTGGKGFQEEGLSELYMTFGPDLEKTNKREGKKEYRQ